MHGLFVDYIMDASTSDALRDQNISKYHADFDITLADVMSSFVGMEIEHVILESIWIPISRRH